MSANYENYKKRMEGVRRFLGVLYRFRALIICAVVFVISAIVALMATNGIVYGEIAPPPEITYGEPFSYEANAFLSGVTYEYCQSGRENEDGAWTTEAPTRAGTYSVRAVAYRTFGSPSYGTTYTFKIKPLEVTLDVADEVVYGERPTLVGALINGDTITDFNFDYAARDSRDTTVYIDSIKAQSSDGEDITDSYVFKTEPESIVFIRREMTVAVNDVTREYDGTPLTSAEYTVSEGSVADGDTLTVECDGEITDEGSVDNNPTFTVRHGDVDVSMQYKITAVSGTLTVTPRRVTVKTADKNWDYDGGAHFDSDYEVVSANDIVTGETAAVSEYTEIVNAGEKDNELTITVTKADGSDSTKNYEFTYECGTLAVDKLVIEIKTESESWVYDGNSHSHAEFTVISETDIVDTEVSYVESGAEISEVGTAENTVTVAVKKADGSDSTDNYEFILREGNTGTLEVTKRAITIKTKTDSRVYDGTVYTDDTIEITSALKLADCDRTFIVSAAGITEVGRIENEVVVKINKSTGEDSTGNYTISYDYGTLTVSERAISVTTASNTWVYDGTYRSDNGYTVTSDVKLADGERIAVSDIATIRNVGSVSNTMTVAVKKADGTDVTNNYTIDVTEGDLTVELCPVTINTSSGEWVYDGAAHYSESYKVTSSRGIAASDTLTVIRHTEIVNAGDAENELDITIADADGEDSKPNYDLTVVNGTLTVTPIAVEVAAASAEKMYDGTPLTVSTYTVKQNGKAAGLELVGGDKLVVVMDVFSETDVTEASGAVTTLTAELCDDGGAPLTSPARDNYDLTVKSGTLKITARPISVTTNSNTWVYDGNTHGDERYTITSAIKLAPEQTASVSYGTDVKTFGSQTNTLVLKITDVAGRDVTPNYDITYTYGTLKVDKRPITLTAGSATRVYNGTELTSSVVTATAGVYNGKTLDTAYANGESLAAASMTAGSCITDVGTEDNVIDRATVSITDGTEDTTVNYEVKLVKGALTVTVREITVKTESSDRVYNGEPYFDERYTVTSELGITERDIATVTKHTEITDVSKAENVLTVSIKTVAGAPSDGNYKINYVNGEIEVTEREITVKTATREWVYDGAEHYDENYEVTSVLKVVSGERVIVATKTKVKNHTPTPVPNELSIAILKANDDISTGNYKIVFDNGTLSVAKRAISITAASAEKKYDGKPLTNSNYGVAAGEYKGEILPYPICLGETLSLSMTAASTITNVGKVANEVDLDTVVIKKSDGEVTTGNYDITLVAGELEITPVKIAISADSDSKVYDGAPLTVDGYVIMVDGVVTESTELVLGDYMVIEMAEVSITDVAESGEETYVSSVTFFDKNGNELDDAHKANYDVVLISGILVIEARPITVRTGSLKVEYDGYQQSCESITVTSTLKIVDGETYSIHGATVVTDYTPEPVDNVLSITITKANGDDSTGNYEITYSYGLIEITKRFVVFLTAENSWVYDGKIHFDEGYDVLIDDPEALRIFRRHSRAVADNETVVVTRHTEVKYVSNTEIGNVLYFRIDKADGTDSTDNYTIIVFTSVISVTPRPITITAGSAQKVYDGEPLTCADYELDPTETVDAGLADGEVLEIAMTDDSVLYSAGATANVIDKAKTKILSGADEDAVDVTANYTITTVDGTLSITVRKITVTAGSATKAYDGLPLTCSDISSFHVDEEGEESFGIAPSDNAEFSMTSASTITEVGEVPNVIDRASLKIYNSTSDDVTDSYDIEYEDGLLKVLACDIVITAGSDEKEYDGTPLTVSDYTVSMDGEIVKPTNGRYYLSDGSYFTVVMPTFSATHVSESTATSVSGIVLYDKNGARVDQETADSLLAVSYVDGMLTITPRIIGVSSAGHIWYYDGKEHYDTGYEVVSEKQLVDGDTMYITDYPTITEIGSEPNMIEFGVTDGDGEDRSDDYAFNYERLGTLEVRKIPMFLTTESDYKVYDGTPLTCDKYSTGSLLDGHTAHVTVTGSQTEIGSSANTAEMYITDADGNDVTDLYEIIEDFGTLTVLDNRIVVKTGSAEKVYDGTPLTNGEYSVEGELSDTVTVSVTVTGSRTFAGESSNDASAVVVDNETGEDISARYEIVYVFGSLVVTPIEITITTERATKPYDGLPLTAPYYVMEGEPIPNDTVEVTVTGSQTEIGSSYNTAEAVFTNKYSGDDVSKSYKVTFVLGKLIVTDPNKKPSSFDDSGDLAKGNDDNMTDPYPVFSLVTQYVGKMYLRYTSYGNYNGKGWNHDIAPYLETEKSALYFGADALKSSDVQGYNTTVVIAKDEDGQNVLNNFILPYYSWYDAMDTFEQENKNDIFIDGSYDEYTFRHFPFTYTSSAVFEHIEIPTDYASYVYDKYLGVRESTADYLRENILDKHPSFNADNPAVIDEIAQFVRTCATYKRDYDSAIDEADDRVIAFFEAGEGLCRHYATLATLLYRMIGIPARYTGGFMVDVKENGQLVTSDTAHAWVEVFVDGIGWVHVEVTGSSEEEKPTLTLKPVDITKEYDGTPLDASVGDQIVEGDDEESKLALAALLAAGYTYEARLNGSRTDAGAAPSNIVSFKLFDNTGRDVTSLINVTGKPGKITVTPAQVMILVAEHQKEYDGTPLTFGSDRGWRYSSKPEIIKGQAFSLDGISITEIGTLDMNKFIEDHPSYAPRFFDANGDEITQNFYVTFNDKSLTVTKRAITVVAQSKKGSYTGRPLTCNRYAIRDGSLVDGHEMICVIEGSIVDFGKTENKIVSVKIMDGDTDVTDYYEIETVNGVLEIID